MIGRRKEMLLREKEREKEKRKKNLICFVQRCFDDFLHDRRGSIISMDWWATIAWSTDLLLNLGIAWRLIKRKYQTLKSAVKMATKKSSGPKALRTLHPLITIL
ncbi:unnamed protein product [Musa banksii]